MDALSMFGILWWIPGGRFEVLRAVFGAEGRMPEGPEEVGPQAQERDGVVLERRRCGQVVRAGWQVGSGLRRGSQRAHAGLPRPRRRVLPGAQARRSLRDRDDARGVHGSMYHDGM